MATELIASPRPRRRPVEEYEGPPGLASRVITALIVGVPFVALVLGVIRFWGRGIHLRDVLLAAVFYLLIGHGMTIGYHRLLAHKSFTARRPIKLILVAFGSMAYEGGPIGWVANHRRHHVFADTASDPHSPRHHGGGVHGRLKGLWHAWHNGHHAFPRSARPGLLRRQWDSSAMLIRALERTALLHDVHWPSPQVVQNRSLVIGAQPPAQHRANAATREGP